MFRNAATLLLLLLSYAAFSQPKGYKTVADEAAFRRKVAETAKVTQTIKSNFIQEKNIQVVSEKIISKGTFRFKKQNKVVMT